MSVTNITDHIPARRRSIMPRPKETASNVRTRASDDQTVVRSAAAEDEVPPSDEPVGNGGGGGLVRVTVNLTPRSYSNLQKISESTKLGKTDVINRALQVYGLVENLLDEGNGSLTIKNAKGEHERIYIL